jgi:formylmethanofuran dehydrogenase subunit C
MADSSKIVLTLKEQPSVPLEAEILAPDHFTGLNIAAICALPVFLGKRQLRVDDFFTVEGQTVEGASGNGQIAAGQTSDDIEIRGDVDKVKWIGRAMTRGRLRIVGNAGMHLGAYMKGGSIEVTGNASDWVGGEMTGGLIHVHGNAGGQIGAAYRGSMQGMRDGTILIGGSAGLEVGMRMRRGIIAIKGPVRDFAGLQMKGGTIVLFGGAELRTGAWMIRGTIISLAPIKLLPTFIHACEYNPTFLRLYAKHLAELGFPIPIDERDGKYQRYSGDSSVPGKGEILIWQPHAAGAPPAHIAASPTCN